MVEHNINRDPMLEMYIFETAQLLEQLEQVILSSERNGSYSSDEINEIFRIMHTIKGSSAMMMFDGISKLAHSIEDIFYFLREEKPQIDDYQRISDFVLEGADFIKAELAKIENGFRPDGIVDELLAALRQYLAVLKKSGCSVPVTGEQPQSDDSQKYYISRDYLVDEAGPQAYKATVFFEEGCEMENIRAFTILHHLEEITEEIVYSPRNILDGEEAAETIRKSGFEIMFKSSKPYSELNDFFEKTIFLRSLEFQRLETEDLFLKEKSVPDFLPENLQPMIPKIMEKQQEDHERELAKTTHQKIISVNVSKLDKLMDLVGELVISEVMVTQNPDLNDLKLDNFSKAARQLGKITGELQDIVMAIRMVPLSQTFQKMNRIVRDMCKKLGKEVELEIIGEETEVDKNIIEHISDPLMHLIRNSIDHGIEPAGERKSRSKQEKGKITLEAKNSGGDVLITVKDDGRGLNRDRILEKARENGLITRPENDMSDEEVFNFVLLPGFSTKSNITEFSGRGVGMDVVAKNIETVGGSVSIESWENAGTAITLKIPLTLAIIDGMNIRVGQSCYTIPTISIKESFRPGKADIITDPAGNEMIMLRGRCYPILSLHKFFKVKTEITEITDGILIMVEQNNKAVCLFADGLLGQQQVVVKALPNYIRNFKKIKGLGGCTLLGDGNISLILDISDLLGKG